MVCCSDWLLQAKPKFLLGIRLWLGEVETLPCPRPAGTGFAARRASKAERALFPSQWLVESSGRKSTRYRKMLESRRMSTPAAHAVEKVYRIEWGRIVATLIRLLGDFDLAEDSAQEAFTAAVDQWDESGVPENPRAWIIQTARN